MKRCRKTGVSIPTRLQQSFRNLNGIVMISLMQSTHVESLTSMQQTCGAQRTSLRIFTAKNNHPWTYWQFRLSSAPSRTTTRATTRHTGWKTGSQARARYAYRDATDVSADRMRSIGYCFWRNGPIRCIANRVRSTRTLSAMMRSHQGVAPRVGQDRVHSALKVFSRRRLHRALTQHEISRAQHVAPAWVLRQF